MQDRARARLSRVSTGRAVAAAALVLVAGTAAVLAFVPDDDGRAAGGVSVDGVAVDGLDERQVATAVRGRAEALAERPLVIDVTDTPARFEVARASLDARPQVRRAVAAAVAPRSPWGRLTGRLGLGSAREVPLRFTLGAERVDALVARVLDGLNRPPRAAAVRVRGEEIVVTPGAEGYGVDPEALRGRILAMPERIDVHRAPLPPPIANTAAERAAAAARGLLATPVAVTFQGRAVELPAGVLRRALRFTPAAPAIDLGLEPAVLREALAPAFASRESAPRDAAFALAGTRATLMPSRTGRALDVARIAREIAARAEESAAPGAIRVPARFVTVEPERTTDELRGLGIEELVGEFTTPYDCCQPRVTNIQRGAELLDGMIIPPGGTFSLNAALGPRTEERGFVAAPQISAGRLQDAIGGGVSQIATTVYNAAFFAGMRIDAHTPHEFYISRYPAGREATVSSGGPELVFTNDWDAGVLVDAAAGENAVTVRLFSRDLGREIETATSEPTDYDEPTVREALNPDLGPGARVVLQDQGGAGFTVSYTRRVRVGDAVKRDERYTWTYEPQDAFVEVGPEPEPKPEAREGRRRPRERPDRDGPTAPGDTTTAPGGAGGTATAPGRGAGR